MQGAFREDAASLELQTAKEILAEVLSIRLADVDEMIANRFEDGARRKKPERKKGCGRRSSAWSGEAPGRDRVFR